MAVQLIEHIEATGLKEEGILRIPGSVTRVKVCDCTLSVLVATATTTVAATTTATTTTCPEVFVRYFYRVVTGFRQVNEN